MVLLCVNSYLMAAEDHSEPQSNHTLLRWDDTFPFKDSQDSHLLKMEWVSNIIDPGFSWKEGVLSWNTQSMPRQPTCTFYVRCVNEDRSSPWFCMGTWDEKEEAIHRTSHDRQENDWGHVETDILVMNNPAKAFQLRLVFDSPYHPKNYLKLLAMSLHTGDIMSSNVDPLKESWGKEIRVRPISQLWYEGGDVWCSPTCVTMVLSYWGSRQGWDHLDLQVPEVVRGLFDPRWNGTGNWSFNVAFAGKHKGIRSYVTRLESIREIESFIFKEVPVIASVSLDALKGRPSLGNGHLITVIGFTHEGDLIVNDPGTRYDLRRVYSREAFKRAWSASKQTVYIIQPE